MNLDFTIPVDANTGTVIESSNSHKKINQQPKSNLNNNRLSVRRSHFAKTNNPSCPDLDILNLTKRVKDLSLNENTTLSRSSVYQKKRSLNKQNTLNPGIIHSCTSRRRKHLSERLSSQQSQALIRRNKTPPTNEFHHTSQHKEYIENANLKTIENRSLPTLGYHLQEFFKKSFNEINPVPNLKITIDKDREDSIFLNLRISSDELSSKQLATILATMHELYDTSYFSFIQLRHIKNLEADICYQLELFRNAVIIGLYDCHNINIEYPQFKELLESLKQLAHLNLLQSSVSDLFINQLYKDFGSRVFITSPDGEQLTEMDLEGFQQKLHDFWSIQPKDLSRSDADKYFKGLAPYFKMLTQFKAVNNNNVSDKHLDIIFNYIGKYSDIIESIDISRCPKISKKSLRSINKYFTGKRIKLLDISHCKKLRSRDVTELTGVLPGLEYIDVTGCQQIQVEFIAPHLQQLINDHGREGQILILIGDDTTMAIKN